MVNTHKHAPMPLHNGDGGQILALDVKRNGKNSPRGSGKPGTLFCELSIVFLASNGRLSRRWRPTINTGFTQE